MLKYRLGYFATSLCGHDKGKTYMIVAEDGEMVGLSDGMRRPLAHPKWKKKKHIQMIRSDKMAQSFPAWISSDDADRRIQREVAAMEEREERKQED